MENNPLNAQILAEAADWLIEFSAGDVDAVARRKFDSWLRASPEHVRAYLEILPVWEDGARRSEASDPGPEALIALARGADNVLPWEPNAAQSGELNPPNTGKSQLRRRAVVAALVSGVLLVGGGVWFGFGGYPTYSTQVGEQRSIELADGSVIELNARSRVRVRFSKLERDVDLLKGQALFRVAKNASRPFIVASGGTRVRAVGTEFDVDRRMTGTTVTVLEGRVEVVRDGSADEPQRAFETVLHSTSEAPETGAVFLASGEQVTATAKALSNPTHTNVSATTAWRQRRLVFDASTLADVVEAFNRYNTHVIVIRDPSLDRFPISAAFSSTDPGSLLRFLRAQPGIRVIEAGDETEILSDH
jgi:transmembrane sensor